MTESPSHSDVVCVECKDSGRRVTIRQIGPNMVQHLETACGDCDVGDQPVPTVRQAPKHGNYNQETFPIPMPRPRPPVVNDGTRWKTITKYVYTHQSATVKARVEQFINDSPELAGVRLGPRVRPDDITEHYATMQKIGLIGFVIYVPNQSVLFNEWVKGHHPWLGLGDFHSGDFYNNLLTAPMAGVTGDFSLMYKLQAETENE